MIYDFPGEGDPIRQGDIFYPVPCIEIGLDNILIMTPTGHFLERNWTELQPCDEAVISSYAKPAWGIIASQDCDAARAPLLSMFYVGLFQKVSGRDTLPKSPKKWVSLITKRARENLDWFYLPPDENLGFGQRMAVSFDRVFQVRRQDLERHVAALRRGRLNVIACEHYRERIAEYFRRYAYDEWYPLNSEEFEEYNKEKGPVQPFEWQKK